MLREDTSPVKEELKALREKMPTVGRLQCNHASNADCVPEVPAYRVL
jgi:hypothetical protein